MISENFNSGFSLDLMIKDVSIAEKLIKKLIYNNSLSEHVSNYLIESQEKLLKKADHTEIYKIFKKTL